MSQGTSKPYIYRIYAILIYIVLQNKQSELVACNVLILCTLHTVIMT